MSESLDEIRKQLDKLQQMLDMQREMGMSTADTEARIAELEQRRDTIRVKGKMVGSVAGSGTVTAENIAGRDIIIQYIDQYVIDDSQRQAVRTLFLDYLDAVWARMVNLPMIAASAHGAGAEDVPLTDVYTALDVTATAGIGGKHDGEMGAEVLEAARGFDIQGLQGEQDYLEKLKARIEAEAKAAEKERYNRRVTTLEAIASAPRRVLVGPAGSGKSTFAKFLALCLAGAFLDERPAGLDTLNRLTTEPTETDWQPWPHGALVPVFVELRKFVRSDHFPPECDGGESHHLLNYIEHEPEPLKEAFTHHLREYLRKQGEGALLILDGLDEVPEAERCRQRLKQVITGFVKRYPNCRVLVTSRPYAYEEGSPWRLDGAGFGEVALAPFDRRQMHTFIDAWYRHLIERGMDAEHAEYLSGDLKQTIAARDLEALAERPLMLTIMADLHAGAGGALPGARAELYEQSVLLLLDRWNEARGIERRALSAQMGMNVPAIRRALQELAFEVHGAGRITDDRAADITGGQLWEALDRHRPEDRSVDQRKVMNYLNERSGILVAESATRYRFPHRSYQEFMAACHLCEVNFPALLADLTCGNPNRWREVFLFAAGRTAQRASFTAWALIERLVPAPPDDPPAKRDDPAWYAALFAAMAIVESELHIRVQTHDAPKLERVRLWLRRILEVGALPPEDRAEAGRVINHLGVGDDRPGVALTPNPSPNGRGELIPDIVWCEVPGGEVQIEGKTFTVEPFYIAKYPVTYKQFQAFIDAEDGIQNDRWWEGLARTQKDDYGQRWQYDNHPRERVTWYQAAAFCRWLSARLGTEITLPTEWQWQQAATGGESSYEYPWGLDWKDDRANSEEAGIGQTSAVGMFPAGASPTGALDMVGNVWEWCANDYDELVVVPSPKMSDWIALRGGAYSDGAPGCGSRFYTQSGLWDFNRGFRVVCARPHLSTEH